MTGRRLDRDDLRALYEQHGRALLAYAISLLQDRSASEDVLQDVFAKLLRRTIVIEGPPLHYLYRAVKNTALNHRRNTQRWTALQSDGHWLERQPGSEDAALAVESAMRELPLEQREIVVLHVWGQLTFAEAAAILDISANTAASRYRYALSKLRERLRPVPEESRHE